MTSKTLLTIEDFEKLPQEMTRNHELVKGELVEAPGNVTGHNRVRDRPGAILLSYVDRTGAGSVIAEQEYGFGRNVHAPDVLSETDLISTPLPPGFSVSLEELFRLSGV